MKQTTIRGVMITDADVLQAMDLFDRDHRVGFPNKRWKTYVVNWNGKSYPPKQLMRLASKLDDVGSGGKPVNSRFEELGFIVGYLDDVEPGIPSDSDSEEEASISLEVDIETALAANLEQLERGLRLYQENGVSGRQVAAKPAGRIDLLAKDADGKFVVIEIKATEADREVCGQIQAYMGWVQERLADGNAVRGIIVANDFTARAVYAAKVVPDLCLKKYQVSFKFSDAPA